MANYGNVVMGDNKFVGILKSATDDVQNGYFVVPDWSAGTASVASGDNTGEIMFVRNEITVPAERAVSDGDFDMDTGDYLKLYRLQNGDILETTVIASTYADVSVDDEMGSVAGKLALIADATASDFTTFRYTFIVMEKLTLGGTNALKVMVKVK